MPQGLLVFDLTREAYPDTIPWKHLPHMTSRLGIRPCFVIALSVRSLGCDNVTNIEDSEKGVRMGNNGTFMGFLEP